MGQAFGQLIVTRLHVVRRERARGGQGRKPHLALVALGKAQADQWAFLAVVGAGHGRAARHVRAHAGLGHDLRRGWRDRAGERREHKPRDDQAGQQSAKVRKP